MIRFRDDPTLEVSSQPVAADPSPMEIRRRCWEIQATWSPDETHRRAGCYANRPVEVEVVFERELVDC